MYYKNSCSKKCSLIYSGYLSKKALVAILSGVRSCIFSATSCGDHFRILMNSIHIDKLLIAEDYLKHIGMSTEIDSPSKPVIIKEQSYNLLEYLDVICNLLIYNYIKYI